MPTLRERYRFFRTHAGGIVGRDAECSLSLARAERTLDNALEGGNAQILWQWDSEPYDAGDAMTPEEYEKAVEENRLTVPLGCVLMIGGEPAASLWGIVLDASSNYNRYGTDNDGTKGIFCDPYARVLEAELASEVLDGFARICSREEIAPLLDNIVS